MFKIKHLFALALVFCFFSQSHAYDTKGKFGMGIRMYGTPLILFSTMKINVANSLGLEPSVGFSQLKIKDTYETSDGKDVSLTNKYNVIIASNVFDIKPIRREKSNFVLRVGAAFWRAKSYWEDYDEFDEEILKDKDILWNLDILGGFGIEHFFTDHFCVYAGFLNGWGIFGSNSQAIDYMSATHVGNQFAELSFIWYL